MAIFGDATATEAARDVSHATVVTLTDDPAVPYRSGKNSSFRRGWKGLLVDVMSVLRRRTGLQKLLSRLTAFWCGSILGVSHVRARVGRLPY